MGADEEHTHDNEAGSGLGKKDNKKGGKNANSERGAHSANSGGGVQRGE
jgi:hypothetical protein